MRHFIYITVGVFLLGAVVLFLPLLTQARIGVGIGTGKITVTEKLRPGGIYTLPSVTILNTGDEGGDYKMDIQYHEKQPQHRPAEEWFSFYPSSFHLEPGEAKTVKIQLSLPVKTEPGDYFAYIEAQPIVTQKIGAAMVGIAAAAKLYFTVVPANLLQGVVYRMTSFWRRYSPWTWVVLFIIVILIAWRWFRKSFHLQIALTKK